MSLISADDLPMSISWFETGMPQGPALGDPETLTWSHFASIFELRRTGDKDGPCVIPSRFKLEADGRQVQTARSERPRTHRNRA